MTNCSPLKTTLCTVALVPLLAKRLDTGEYAGSPLGCCDTLVALTRAQQIEEQGLDVAGIKHTITDVGCGNESDKTVLFPNSAG